ncbi:hypothetical protein AYO41_05335 [Verrucomicrobia bacterium SCGC AG-212-E04]|nr:hypothetical protein AYO41_05335 [Verrucomicrobia bacterium SCGC AG-212-E04]
MTYLILIYGAESAWAGMPQSNLKEMYDAYMTYTDELAGSGSLRGGHELQPTHTATTVRVRDGKVLKTDGPFAETKEQLGGFYIIDVPNLDAALEWASKCPGAKNGCTEVRPIVDHSKPRA